MAAQQVEQVDGLPDRLTAVRAALAAIPLAAYADQPPAQARAVAAELRGLESIVATHVGAAVRAVERLVPARDPRQLLAGDFGHDPAAAHRQLKQARLLAAAAGAEQAAAAGEISHAHATVIGSALRELPEEVTGAQKRLAERVLIADAKTLSPRELATRARRVTELWAEPEQVDDHEDRLLARREERARLRSSLAMWDNRDGTWSGAFTLPDLQARMLKTVIDAYAAPRRNHLAAESAARASGEPGFTRVQRARADAEERRPYDRKAGEALMAVIEHLPTDALANTGGTPARIIVMIEEAKLRSSVAAATLATGERLSAGQLRRLACSHGILPAVLGGASVPVDLGRSQRLFSSQQRDALAAMDGGCVAPGCDRPPAWCEAHHGDPWQTGGGTGLDNGFLLCSAHHHQAHQQDWRFRRRSDGGAEIDQRRGSGWQRHHRYRP